MSGVSAGGELALATGIRHPDIYGAVLRAPPGAGYEQEPFFLDNAVRWAAALRTAGAGVVMTERVGSHGDAFWRHEFPLMAAWAFRS